MGTLVIWWLVMSMQTHDCNLKHGIMTKDQQSNNICVVCPTGYKTLLHSKTKQVYCEKNV